MQTAAETLATRAVGLYGGSLTTAVSDRVAAHLLDFLGNALGGSTAASSRAVAGAVAGVPDGGFTAIGLRRVALPEYAAFANGAFAHALESDDTHQPSSSHPAVAVFPAALAAGEATGASGRAVALAAVAGYEVMARVGMALGPAEQYAHAYHPTATCGVFGAATAAGLLLGLDAAQLASALGIAGSQSAGLLAFLDDGSQTKPFHAGWAAHSGMLAARLAANGLRGPRQVFEGPHGLFHAMGAAQPQAATAPWDELQILRTSIKAHACCRYKQAPIDGVLAIMREEGLSAGDVREIEIGVLSAGWTLVADPIERKRRPQNVVDAQFSMPYGAAVAVLFGRASVPEYREDLLANPDLQDLMARVRCVRDPGLDAAFPYRWPATVRITTTNGRTFHRRVEYPKGDPENPLSWSELAEKFRALSAGVVSPAEADAIIEACAALAGLPDVRDLTARLPTPGAVRSA